MAFPRYLKGGVESFCDELVRKRCSALTGSVYDDNANHFRLGLGRRNLPQAISRFKAFLETGS